MSSSLRKASCYCGNPITFHEILVKIDTYNGFVGIPIMIRYYNPCIANTTRFFWALVARPFSIFAASFCSVPFSKHVHVDYVKTWPSEHIPRFSHSNNMLYYQVLRDSSICKKTGWNVFPKNMSQNASANCFFHGRKFYTNKHRLAKRKSPESWSMRPDFFSNLQQEPFKWNPPRKVWWFFVFFHSLLKISSPREYLLHPGRIAWNLQIIHLERKMIFQTSMIMFHVNLPGCKKCHGVTKWRGHEFDQAKDQGKDLKEWQYRITPPHWATKKKLRYFPLYYIGFLKRDPYHGVL